MNALIFCTPPLLLLAGFFLVIQIISRLNPWEICKSPADLLAVPLAAAYILILLGGAWVLIGAESLQVACNTICSGSHRPGQRSPRLILPAAGRSKF